VALLAADVGGTHARFALAHADGAGGIGLSHVARLKVAEHASLETALQAYARRIDQPLPDRLALAVATPVDSPVLKFTNSPWVIQPALLAERGGFAAMTLLNDFAAVAHAAAVLPQDQFAHVAGPDVPLPARGGITVLGPGTGLGVALLLRAPGFRHVQPTEAGHVDFAPLDSLEDRLLERLRQQFRRVSVERIVSGPGLAAIHAALAAIERHAIPDRGDAALWEAALGGTDALARAALDRWCLSLGAVAGDLALAHGAAAVVLAGGLAARIAPRLATSGFHSRFVAKGRFEARMAALPIRRILFAEPGLLGAAAAHMAEHGPC
jgi:glucokinase